MKSFKMCLVLMVFFQFSIGQNRLEVVLPEGLSNVYNPNVVVNNSGSQAMFSHYDSNKLFVWDLRRNDLAYTVNFNKAIRYTNYHPEESVFFISTEDSVFVFESDSGREIIGLPGSNNLYKGLQPFKDNSFLYIGKDSIKIANYTTKKVEQSFSVGENLMINNAGYVPAGEEIFIDHETGFSIYKPSSEIETFTDSGLSSDEVWIDSNKVILKSDLPVQYKVYDRSTLKVLHDLNVDRDSLLVEIDKKIYLKNADLIVVKDILTNTESKEFSHPFDYLNKASFNKDKDQIVFFGEIDHQTEFRVYDLEKEFFSDPTSSNNEEISSYPNFSFFSKDAKYVYQIYEDRIHVNSVLTGALVDVYHFEAPYFCSNYPFQPKITEENNLLVLLQHNSDSTEKLISLDLDTGKIIWTKELPDNTEYIKIFPEYNRIEHKSGFKNFGNEERGAVISFISAEDGNTFYSKQAFLSPQSFFFHVSEEEIIEVFPGSYSTGDSLKINVLNIKNGTERIENLGVNEMASLNEFYFFDNTLLAQNDEEIVFIKTDIPFEIGHSVKIDPKFEAIDFLEQEQILVLKEKYETTGEFQLIDLKTKKSLFDSLTLLQYQRSDHTALVKNMEGELFHLNLRDKKQLATGEILEEESETKLFNEHHFLFSRNDSLILFDTRENRIIEKIDAYFSDVEDLGPGGHLYLNGQDVYKIKDASVYQELKNDIELPDHLWDLAVTPDNNSFLFFDKYNGILNKYNPGNSNLEKYSVFSESDNSRKESLEFLNDETLFVTDLRSSYDATLEQHFIFDLKSGIATNITGRVDEFESYKIYDNKILITNSPKALRVFNLESGENIKNFQAHSFLYLEDKQFLFLDNGETITLYNIALSKPEWEVNIPRSYYKSFFGGLLDDKLILINDNKLLALNLHTGHLEGETVLNKNYDGPFSPLSVSGSSIFINEGNIFETQIKKYKIAENVFVKENFERNESFVPDIRKSNLITENDLFMVEDDVLVVYYLSKNQILIKDMASEEALFEASLDMSSIELEFNLSADSKSLFLSNSNGEVALINFGEQPGMERYNFKGKDFQLKDGFLFANDYGKKIDVYSWENQELLYSVLPIKEDNYVIYTPSGYYFSTKEAAEYLKFKLNNNYYSFDQFDLIFNRPHLVLEAMGSGNSNLMVAYEKAYLKRVQRQDYSISSAIEAIPVVKVLNKNDISNTMEKASVEINITAEDNENLLSKLFVKINGNQLMERDLDQKKFSSALQIDLNKGKNLIEIFAVNKKGLKSLTERISIDHDPKTATEAKIYFVGIGVSEYENENYNLKYAAKDIIDLSRTLKERYPNIIIDTLLNENVTLPNILRLKERLKETAVNDQIMVSFCGHGVLDDDLNWFFATSDMDFEDPGAKGLSYEILESLTAGVSARQKLVTIDACHSGEIDMEEIDESDSVMAEGNVKAFARGSKVVKSKSNSQSTYALMKEIFSDIESGNGTVVISASGGMEFAFEDKEYQNGVFTYSLIKKLEESIWNSLNVSELQEHVISQVFELTDGLQRPTVRAGNLTSDWIVW